jgi:hypothetical protein
MNNKYYSSQNVFNLRNVPDPTKVVGDGQYVECPPAKNLVSAFQRPDRASNQFRVKIDKKRVNINTNTVTFAQKYSKSQPRHKIIKQTKKESDMMPGVGFYDAADMDEREVKNNNKGISYAKTLGRDEVEGRRGQKR